MVIEIFSIHKINRLIKHLRNKYELLTIRRTYSPSINSYVIFRIDKSNIDYPIECVIGSMKGFVEAWIHEDFDVKRIMQEVEFESMLDEKEHEIQILMEQEGTTRSGAEVPTDINRHK